MKDLQGKVAVVTGGARGLGLGIARALAEQDMRIVLADVDEPALDSAVATLRASGVDVIGVPTDVCDADAITRLRDAAFERFETVHVLCNNAGGGGGGGFREPIDVERWQHAMTLCVYSVLRGLNAFLPRMMEQREGHIVNTASRQGLIPMSFLGAYPPAKAAIITLSEMLHAELGEANEPIGVTVLTPGGVRTEGIVESLEAHRRGEYDDEAVQEFLEARVAAAVEPIELGRLVVAAIREGALYVNTHRETLVWLQERVDRMVADADRIGTLRG